ncbi:hypothetical protein LEP1GSC170_3736 [Leptospira interrogans serovar Bataviae str. HAI135]|nr:hypothetical protein LEP1GSC170_3736 [Leptospira interrogans serovar Bataviae str. HAI135]
MKFDHEKEKYKSYVFWEIIFQYNFIICSKNKISSKMKT